MYQVEKRFTLPMGHRLSKHKGRCSSIHGHNITVLVGVSSKELNDNYMVIDFSDLKRMVQVFLDEWDHCLLVNENDWKFADVCSEIGMRVKRFDFDPTAEKLAELLFNTLKVRIKNERTENNVTIDYVTIYENENSKCTYREDS